MVFVEFDLAKSAKNLRDRGIGFERFADMDLEAAVTSRTRAKTTANGACVCSATLMANFTQR